MTIKEWIALASLIGVWLISIGGFIWYLATSLSVLKGESYSSSLVLKSQLDVLEAKLEAQDDMLSIIKDGLDKASTDRKEIRDEGGELENRLVVLETRCEDCRDDR